MITEAKIEAKLVAYCRKNSLLTYKFVSASNRGVPDRIIMGFGKVMFLELKRPGLKPTELQFYVGRRIQASGIYWDWADSSTSAEGKVAAFFFSAKESI